MTVPVKLGTREHEDHVVLLKAREDASAPHDLPDRVEHLQAGQFDEAPPDRDRHPAMRPYRVAVVSVGMITSPYGQHEQTLYCGRSR